MAKELNNSQGKTLYLRINKDGYFYTSSKEAEEGRVKITLDNGAVVYHKLYPETEDGKFTYIAIKEVDTGDGKSFQMFQFGIEGSDGSTDMIQVPMYKTSGGLNDYVKSMAVLLPNVDFSKTYSVSASKGRNQDGYLYKNFFINIPGAEKSHVEPAHRYTNAKGEGDIPRFEKTVKFGKTSYNSDAQDEYLFNILSEQIERFKAFKSENGDTSHTQNEKPVENSKPNVKDEEDDELPF